MGRLYILTGPAGVGKSTISKGIAERLEKSVLLERWFLSSSSRWL